MRTYCYHLPFTDTFIGNYANEYGANVGSPLNYPTAQWNTGL